MNEKFTTDEFRFFLTTVVDREDIRQVKELHDNSVDTLNQLYAGIQQNMDLVNSFTINDISKDKVLLFRNVLSQVENVELTPFEAKCYMRLIRRIQAYNREFE